MPRVLKTGRVAKTRVLKTGRVAKTRVADTLFGEVRRLSRGYPIFLGANTAVDGGTGNIVSFADSNDPTHLLTQAQQANQITAAPAPDSTLGNASCVRFTDTVQNYVSNRPGSAWAKLFEGFTCYVVGNLTTPLVASKYFWALSWLTGTTAMFLSEDSSNSVRIRVRTNGSDRTTFTYAAAAGAQWIKAAYTANQLGVIKKNGVAATTSVASGGIIGALADTFWIGKSSNGSNGALWSMHSVSFFPYLSPAEDAVVQAWIQAATGLAP